MSKFRYKKQAFQQCAVDSVVGMLNGLPNRMLASFQHNDDGQSPIKFMHENQEQIELNLKRIQSQNNIRTTQLDLLGDYLTLDTQMETGTGKTFTFINTIYELNKRFNLTHFIIIVPSVAIKEGIKKAFETTADYFFEFLDYKTTLECEEINPSLTQKGRRFPSAQLRDFVDNDTSPKVLIMTNAMFNSANKVINRDIEGYLFGDAKTPMESIAKRSPVLIVDEPQRIGNNTEKYIKNFNPLFVLRYSATFKHGQMRNPVYILDSYNAFHDNLVKSIAVTDYQIDKTSSEFLGVRRIADGIAELHAMNSKGKLVTVTTKVEPNETSYGTIYQKTKNKDHRDLRVIKIDSVKQSVSLSDGRSMFVGVYNGGGSGNDRSIAEVMLQDTISRHLQKEKLLFMRQGKIKCLSLIFVDHVKDYRDRTQEGDRGWLQGLFEECYNSCVEEYLNEGDEYSDYLKQMKASEVHGGYFATDAQLNKLREGSDGNEKTSHKTIGEIDRKNALLDSGKAGDDKRESRELQEEISKIILRDKEKILHTDNKLRFIFAHSALREGWDNPNVFQICKLRTGFSIMNIVQEVGRGLRLCVDNNLERQDMDAIANKAEFSEINKLDVFTLGNGEFIGQLQKGLDKRKSELKYDVVLTLTHHINEVFGLTSNKASELANQIIEVCQLDENGYLQPFENLRNILAKNKLAPDGLDEMFPIYTYSAPTITDTRKENKKGKTYKVNRVNYEKFKELWNLLHQNVVYKVDYSPDFMKDVAEAINHVNIQPVRITRKTSMMKTENRQFRGSDSAVSIPFNTTDLISDMKIQDFISQISEETDLPRNSVIDILSLVEPKQFKAIQSNPADAIKSIVNVIVGVINSTIYNKIRYVLLKNGKLRGEPENKVTLSDKTFTATRSIDLNSDSIKPTYKGNNLWDEIAPYDSEIPEREISESSLQESRITVFAKLPKGIKIPIPVNRSVSPDFAFVIHEKAGGEESKQFYFVAEAKTSTDAKKIRGEESDKIKFLKRYFDCINEISSKVTVQFLAVSDYKALLTEFDKVWEK